MTCCLCRQGPYQYLFSVYITLHRLLVKELCINNSFGNPTKEEILDNHRSGLLSNRWRTGSTITTVFLNYTSVLTNIVILLGLSNAPKNLFQIINIYSISTQNQTSELLWHYLLKGWCESDVDSEELYKPWYCDTIYSRGGVNRMWRTL